MPLPITLPAGINQFIGNFHIAVFLNYFLQTCFIIGINSVFANKIKFLLHQAQQKFFCGGKPLVDIVCTQNRFKSICQNRSPVASAGKVFTFAEAQVLAERNFMRILC